MQSITECYRVLQQSVTAECHRVLQSVTECHRVLQSVTETNLAHLRGPIFGLVCLSPDLEACRNAIIQLQIYRNAIAKMQRDVGKPPTVPV